MTGLLPLLTVLVGAHPSLYYEPADVPMYQTQASGPRASLASSLRAGAAELAMMTPATLSFEPDRGSALVSISVTCMLTADPTVCATAHTWVTGVMALLDPSGDWESPPDFVESNYLLGLAIAYDVLSDSRLPSSLSASEQSQLRSLITAGCAYFYGLSTSGQLWYSQEWSQNHNWSDYGALGVAALALMGEVPAADTWLAHAVADYANIGVVLARITDGTWHEGFSYESGAIAAWLWFPAAVRHAELEGRLSPGTPDFTESPWLEAFGHYRAVGSLPGNLYENVFMHGDFYGWSGDGTVLGLRYGAARFADSEAQWLAQAQLAQLPHTVYGPEQATIGLEYLVFNPTVSAVPPTASDLLLGDLAGFISRSGYDANAAVLGVKAGAFGGLANWNAMANGLGPGADLNFAHDHVDDLGFWFYANGQWLAPEAVGYVEHPTPDPSFPPCEDTRFHNTITVDGIGQLGDDNWASGDTLSPQIDFSRQGSVAATAALTDLSYAELEGVHLYPASLGLTRATRQVLFAGRQTVVVRDQLESSLAHTYQWNSHAMNGAVQSAGWIQGVSFGDQALGIRVLAPATWTFSTDVQTPQQVNDTFDLNGAMTHFVVANASAAASMRFLVAMEPTTSTGWAARGDIEALDSASPASGLVLPDGSRWIVGDTATSVSAAGGLTLQGTAGAVRSSVGGNVFTLVRASSLQQQGTEVLSADATGGAIEAAVTTGRVDIQAAAVTRARILASGLTAATWNGAPVSFSVDPQDGAHVFVPGIGSGPPDAGSAPPADAGASAADAGASPAFDAGATLPADAGARSSSQGTPGGGSVSGSNRVRGTCGSAGAEPAVLLVLALLGAARQRRT